MYVCLDENQIIVLGSSSIEFGPSPRLHNDRLDRPPGCAARLRTELQGRRLQNRCWGLEQEAQLVATPRGQRRCGTPRKRTRPAKDR